MIICEYYWLFFGFTRARQTFISLDYLEPETVTPNVLIFLKKREVFFFQVFVASDSLVDLVSSQ